MLQFVHRNTVQPLRADGGAILVQTKGTLFTDRVTFRTQSNGSGGAIKMNGGHTTVRLDCN
jgi:hypothetical protein